jgi:hypothetical protein
MTEQERNDMGREIDGLLEFKDLKTATTRDPTITHRSKVPPVDK